MAMVNKLAREINERQRERVDSSLVGDVDVPGPSLAKPDSFPETVRSSSNDNSFPEDGYSSDPSESSSVSLTDVPLMD